MRQSVSFRSCNNAIRFEKIDRIRGREVGVAVDVAVAQDDGEDRGDDPRVARKLNAKHRSSRARRLCGNSAMRSLGRELGHMRERPVAHEARETLLFSSRDRIDPLRDADVGLVLTAAIPFEF